jgi:O-antigen ligase
MKASGVNLSAKVIFAIGLMVLMPSFVLELAVDPVTFQFQNSRILQAGNLVCGTYALGIIVTSRQIAATVRRCWPVLLQIVIAYCSLLWSYNFSGTLRGADTFLIASVFGFALAGKTSAAQSIQLIIRTMTLACMLSVVWVLVFPQQGIHQLTDPFQTVHAGLWRGIFSHKQALGVISGMTTGLLFFYGAMAFRSIPVRVGAIACSSTCLLGTGSVTGMMIAVILPLMLYVTYWIATRPPSLRKGLLLVFVLATAMAYGAFHIGVLNFLLTLLGKSVDLTGRAEFWPWVLANVRANSFLLGGGLASGWAEVVAPSISIDNGYIELVVSFGYLGAAIVIGTYVWLAWLGARLILLSGRHVAAEEIFPFCIVLIELLINITETNFMTKTIHTILMAVAVYRVTQRTMSLRSGARHHFQLGNRPQPNLSLGARTR